MGQRSKRNAEFLAAHPVCCFCGGGKSSETIDHIPARALFLNRQWPEGYAFPACAACNAASRDDERLMALAVRIKISENYSDQAIAELERSVEGVRYRFPELARRFRELSRVETRQYLRERGVKGPTGEIYVVEPPQELFDATNRYGAKLAKALHFKHTGSIVPAGAAVQCTTVTNGALLKEDFPKSILELLQSAPRIERHKTMLDDQFTYRFAIVESGDAAGYWVVWGESIGMLLAVFEDAERYAEVRATRMKAMSSPLPANPPLGTAPTPA
jgi:hypothetical protein